jgi:hypothetical protein
LLALQSNYICDEDSAMATRGKPLAGEHTIRQQSVYVLTSYSEHCCRFRWGDLAFILNDEKGSAVSKIVE